MRFEIGICDDETIMQQINSLYIQNIADKFNLDIMLHTFSSGEELLDFSKNHPLHIVFLDIDMVGVSGIETAFSLRKYYPDIVTIFITGHTEYAIEAFDTEAIGYIMKPVDATKLERIFIKAINYVKMTMNTIRSKSITFVEDNIKKKLPQHQIIYFEKEGNQCKIITAKSTHYWYTTIKNILDILDDDFIQINQGIIANKRYIASIIKGDLILKNGDTFKIGRKYLPNVRASFFPE